MIKHRHSASFGLAILACVLAAGCTSSDYDSDFFDFDPARSRTRTLLNAQAAKGAAEDQTLGRPHFDGTTLNALGRQKLDLMLRGNVLARGGVIRVAPLPGESEQARSDERAMVASVRSYLTACGVAEAEPVRVADSPAHRDVQEDILAIRVLRSGVQGDSASSASGEFPGSGMSFAPSGTMQASTDR